MFESKFKSALSGGNDDQSASAAEIPGPRFPLTPNMVVSLDKRECVVERRLNDKWYFLTSENEPLRFTDRQIAEMQANGSFHVVSKPGGRDDERALPVTPLNVGENAHKENMRRLAYVLACKKHPAFAISRKVLNPVIEAVAVERRKTNPGEKQPCFSAVVSWIGLWEKHGNTFGAAALTARHDRKGRYGGRLAEYQLKAIEAGKNVWLMTRCTAQSAYATVVTEVMRYDNEDLVDKENLDQKFLDENGNLKPPSLREFERRCNLVPPAVRDAMRIGARYARRNYRTYGTTSPPDRPYQEVEVDDCTLDILLRHRRGVILGRPNLVIFRDRATGMILGWGFGYDQPSYAAFLLGLENAIHGPDVSRFPNIKNTPFWYGRCENLFHDNALHQIGKSIEEASQQLGINLVRLQPRQPWLKGALEGWFRKAGVGFVHDLPGTTLEHMIARRDHENLGEVTVYVDQFEALLAEWVCDIYNVSPTKLNGFIRGFDSGISPSQAFRSKLKDYQTDFLPPRELFVAIAGEITERTIQNNGITIDYITYEGPNLARVIGHPKHRNARRNGESTKYKVARDPHDLGHIFLVNHHTNERLEIRAVAAHAEYANGLTLVEHEIILKNAREGRNKLTFRELAQKRAELNAFALQVSASPKFKTVQRKLGRWLEGDRLREQRSKVKPFAPDGADYLEPQVAPAAESTIVEADGLAARSNTTAPPQANAPEASTHGHDDFDIEEFENQKGWEAI